MAKKTSYAQLRTALDEIMKWFEQDTLDVDEAIAKYEQAMKLTHEIEAYLKNAENKISKLKGA